MDSKTEKPERRISSEPAWLSSFPALASIQDKAWRDALRAAEEMVIPSETTVVRRGDPCMSFILVSQGTLRIYESSDSGFEIVLYRTCGGEPCILTLNTLLTGGRYAAEARTDGEVRAVAISEALFRRLMNESDAFRNFIMGTLARGLGNVMQTVEQVTFQQLDLRLACLLGQLFGQNKSTAISITHDDLARELGTRRVVVSRMLKEFEQAGMIRLAFRRIELVSPKTLARLAQGR